MRISRNVVWVAALSLVLTSAALGVGCGSSPSSPSSSGSGEGGKGGEGQGGQVGQGGGVGGAGQGGAGGQGGASEGGGGQGEGGAGGEGGSALQCAPSSGAVLAINKLFVGDKDPDGTPNAVNGWKQYGFNIDGLVSTAASVDLCKPRNGAPPSTPYPDGNDGIDNSFGKNILPLFQSLAPNFSDTVNAGFQGGNYTLMVHLDQLGPGPDAPSIVTKLYGGAPLGSEPSWDGTDCWPLVREHLSDPADKGSAKIVFDKSSVAGDVWSSGVTATVVLDLSLLGTPVKLTIHQARLSMKLDPDHAGATAGQLGGVVDTEELVAELKKVVGTFNPSLCNSPMVEAMANQYRQASDILKDGTQDPAVECDGISIGLGFTMDAVNLGDVAPAVDPQPNPCAP